MIRGLAVIGSPDEPKLHIPEERDASVQRSTRRIATASIPELSIPDVTLGRTIKKAWQAIVTGNEQDNQERSQNPVAIEQSWEADYVR